MGISGSVENTMARRGLAARGVALSSAGPALGPSACLNCGGMLQDAGLGACCCRVPAIPWPQWFSIHHLPPKVTQRRGEGA